MTVQFNKSQPNPATALRVAEAHTDFINGVRSVAPAAQAAAESLRRLAETIDSGPRTGLVRIGPGIAGLRTVTL